MSDVHGDLRAYYEEEARLGCRTVLRGFRTELRDRFIELLRSEDRRSVVDFGAGPGLDGPGFLEHGIRYVGLDLAHGNARLATESGVTVLHGSIAHPPLRPATFHAGWSMSTLMHIPEAQVPTALAGMVGPLESGAPMLIGLWGAQAHETFEHVDQDHLEGQQRRFSLRSRELNRSLLEGAGTIESDNVRDAGEAGWEYQIFRLRCS